MKARRFLGILVLGAVVFTLFFGFGANKAAAPGGGMTLTLKAPDFVTAARAEGGDVTSGISDKLDAEAGISAYYKAPTTITFNATLRNVFRTIEVETTDYIIGSVPIINYLEHFDAHVYVNKNGWLLAYYLRQDPVSKIVDVKAQTIATTKLKSAVSSVASAAGIAVTDVTYYDFRYPAATNMLFVSEEVANGNDFTIQLPSTYGYHERSWASARIDCCTETFTVDGVSFPNRIFAADYNSYGTLTASQLLPDVSHVITVEDFGVLVIVYSVP